MRRTSSNLEAALGRDPGLVHGSGACSTLLASGARLLSSRSASAGQKSKKVHRGVVPEEVGERAPVATTRGVGSGSSLE